MMPAELIGARGYAEAHRTSGKRDLVEFIAAAVEASNWRVLAISDHTRAPVHVSAISPDGIRVATTIYAFRSSTDPIKGRDPDERRFQLRLGGEDKWGDQRVGFDPTRAEPTLMVGVDLEREVFVAVDPTLYDPLPSGNSIEYRVEHLERAQRDGWHVWERPPRAGRVRAARLEGLETLVFFRPNYLMDWVALEAQAQTLRLTHGLRFRAAERAGLRPASLQHDLEGAFELSAAEILDVIASARRLGVAVRGGVAELHLERVLGADPAVAAVRPIDEDGMPDFEVELVDGRTELVECKVCSPHAYADGTPKVEVQKTRASKSDPASRFYRPDQFHVVAACVWPTTGAWAFRYRRSESLERHGSHPDRLAVLHRIDESWSSDYPVAV